jgi:hypothetical protein
LARNWDFQEARESSSSTQVATSFDDSAAYGDLYQWGRAKDGHEDRTRNSTSATLTSGIDTGANDNSALVGTLKPAGQMSLTPSFAQAAILAKPLLSAVFATQSKGKARQSVA